LKVAQTFDTVAHDMPSSRPNRRRRVERREVRAARRARRFALLTLLAIVLVIALALTAFGGNSRQLEALAVANPAAGLQTKPFPQVLAMHGVIRLQMPIAQNQFTAIGFHSATDGAIPLAPIGHQGNEGVVQRFFHKVFGGGAWSSELAPGRAVRVAVNHDIAQSSTPVRTGDEVALFPPVTGG